MRRRNRLRYLISTFPFRVVCLLPIVLRTSIHRYRTFFPNRYVDRRRIHLRNIRCLRRRDFRSPNGHQSARSLARSTVKRCSHVSLVVLPSTGILPLRFAVGRFDGQCSESVLLAMSKISFVDISRRFIDGNAFAYSMRRIGQFHRSTNDEWRISPCRWSLCHSPLYWDPSEE